MTKYVLSTMTQSVSYNTYGRVGDLPVLKEKIIVRGGANIPSSRSGFGEVGQDGEGQPLWTAAGMVTPISDERYEVLKDHPLFKRHLDAGLVKVVNNDITGNHKAVLRETRSMTPKDGFAQLTKSTDERLKVTTKTVEQETQFRL